tara:strand:- start:12622 stop:12885 length:264 start_codon:yes stop_codon:yes gene_type:complete
MGETNMNEMLSEFEDRYKEAVELQGEIVIATERLRRLGYDINVKYIEGAGWASKIERRQESLDAEYEKNQDYALDNMTGDYEDGVEL